MADVEQLLIGWLGQQFPEPDARFGTETPADLQNQLPFGRVTRIGGPREFALDHATVVVDAFHTDRTSAKAFAQLVEKALYWELAAANIGVGRVRTLSGPSWAPWENTDLRRFTAIYQINFRNL